MRGRKDSGRKETEGKRRPNGGNARERRKGRNDARIQSDVCILNRQRAALNVRTKRSHNLLIVARRVLCFLFLLLLAFSFYRQHCAKRKSAGI